METLRQFSFSLIEPVGREPQTSNPGRRGSDLPPGTASVVIYCRLASSLCFDINWKPYPDSAVRCPVESQHLPCQPLESRTFVGGCIRQSSVGELQTWASAPVYIRGHGWRIDTFQ